MSISIKSKKDIEKMKIAGRKATSVLEMLKNYVVPGVSTAELDSLGFKFIKYHKEYGQHKKPFVEFSRIV